eukprot:COSAG03_NODE_425_length_8018_cov_3.175906_5_plen_44_part_00
MDLENVNETYFFPPATRYHLQQGDAWVIGQVHKHVCVFCGGSG